MRKVPLTTVRLVTSARLDVALLRREFPTVDVQLVDACGTCDAIVDANLWQLAQDFRPFDAAVESSISEAISVRGASTTLLRAACEVLTRYQRHVRRRNAASQGPLFDTILRAHAGLHDMDKPLVRADHDHAIDTWQWMLRLDPDASLAAQAAALFHDVERLVSEADRRIEHHAPDYQAFKDAHAAEGAAWARKVLLRSGVESPIAARAHAIIASHERRGADPEVDLLNDADALSFFSLNSAGYADYFGPAQTRRKVAYTLARAGMRALQRLRTVRLRADVAAMLAEAVAA